jgi:3-deoxy-D-manno-octulosonic-acid transferase
MAAALAAAGATQTIADGEELSRAVSALLADPAVQEERAAAGACVAADGSAVLDRILDQLARLLDALAPAEGASRC